MEEKNSVNQNTNIFKPLTLNYNIPEILQDNINLFIKDLNERNGQLADCYEEEIRSILNGCDEDLDEEQIGLLRWYYCKGGIYLNTTAKNIC